jgi:hypothetical protein
MLLLTMAAMAQEAPAPVDPAPQPSDQAPALGEQALRELVLREAVFQRTPGGLNRRRLLAVGAGGMAAGAIWYMAAADITGQGDQALALAGAGLVAVGGAVIGGGVAALAPPERPMDFEAGGPPLGIRATMGGTNTIGETVPYGGRFDVAPRFQLGEYQLLLTASLRGDLGRSLDIDPRPQGDFPAALETLTTGMDLEPELRRVVHRKGGLDERGLTLELRARPTAWVRTDRLTTIDGNTRKVRREAWIAAVGVRWHLSHRQRLTVYAGPRWDSLSWSEGGDFSPRTTWLGPMYGAATYEMNFDHPYFPGPWDVSGRARLSYIHSNFDGGGLNVGAAIGFFGPLEVRYDLRFNPPDRRSGPQIGVGATMNDQSTVWLAIGWNAPVVGSGR